MTTATIDIIPPQHILDSFGSYSIGFAESLKGNGGPDDGRFMDLCIPWSQEGLPVLKARYLRMLVTGAKRSRANFMEFWGWPEIRFRDDDWTHMIYSRVRFMHVIAVPPQGRPN